MNIEIKKEKIYPVLLNKNDVKEGIAIDEFCGDIVIAYTTYQEKDGYGRDVFATIGYTDRKEFGELRNTAMENLMRGDLPETELCFKSMAEMLRDLMGSEVNIPDDNETEQKMFVLTNKLNKKGAGQILRPDLLRNFCIEHKINSVYIIPSSIHELLLIIIDDNDKERLAEIINEVNMSVLEPGEFLSNYLYKYLLETNEISVVAGNENGSK